MRGNTHGSFDGKFIGQEILIFMEILAHMEITPVILGQFISAVAVSALSLLRMATL
jgi:hypothetical protein